MLFDVEKRVGTSLHILRMEHHSSTMDVVVRHSLSLELRLMVHRSSGLVRLSIHRLTSIRPMIPALQLCTVQLGSMEWCSRGWFRRHVDLQPMVVRIGALVGHTMSLVPVLRSHRRIHRFLLSSICSPLATGCCGSSPTIVDRRSNLRWCLVQSVLERSWSFHRKLIPMIRCWSIHLRWRIHRRLRSHHRCMLDDSCSLMEAQQWRRLPMRKRQTVRGEKKNRWILFYSFDFNVHSICWKIVSLICYFFVHFS